ncbi:hypothetical protein K438DRAFT_1788957 [Mycena galopus ATCC 62051]|nr:hypothetical protein K438DRAFT_1788957 [Mycena galopus ATCC 62051]
MLFAVVSRVAREIALMLQDGLGFQHGTTLADTPFDETAFLTFLVNYDFPIKVAQAPTWSTLPQNRGSSTDSSTVNPQYMRLMARYSADTVAGLYTLEVGRFGQRAFYPGANSVTLTLQTPHGRVQTEIIPWAATFVESGNTTASFISETCLAGVDSVARKRAIDASLLNQRRKSVVSPEAQGPIRQAASANGGRVPRANNVVQPNLTSFGHFATLEIYQLAEHPKVGVIYFEQFEPSDGTDANNYFDGISDTLFSGFNALKAAGVEKIIVDNSGNRGGYIFAGAIAMGHSGRRRESDVAAASGLGESEYSYFYRDLSMRPNYVLFQNNSQFMNPTVPEGVNGVWDAYSKKIFDDFGDSSAAVMNFTTPPFADEDYVFVTNSICASTCSIFSSYLFQKHGVRSAVFGGTPSSTISQFDGGVKGSEVADFDEVIFELQLAGLDSDPAAPQPFPVAASFTMNFRNAFPYIDKQDGIWISQRASNSHRELATHTARASAFAASLSPQPWQVATPSQPVPKVVSDDLPMISMDDQKVAVGWDTRAWSRLYGVESFYNICSHNIWLRDHCRCPECFHPITKQILIDTFEIPPDIMPSQIEPTADGLQVSCTNNELSFFVYLDHSARAFLTTPHIPLSLVMAPEKFVKILWGSKIQASAPTVTYEEAMAEDDRGLYKWVSHVDRFGMCFISGVPPTPDATEELSKRIGFIHETQYGKFWDFTSDLAKGGTPYITLALGAHTDNTFYRPNQSYWSTLATHAWKKTYVPSAELIVLLVVVGTLC